MDNTTVKIKKELLDRVEKIVEDKFEHIKYANKKQFVNAAVLELLRQEEEKKKEEGK